MLIDVHFWTTVHNSNNNNKNAHVHLRVYITNWYFIGPWGEWDWSRGTSLSHKALVVIKILWYSTFHFIKCGHLLMRVVKLLFLHSLNSTFILIFVYLFTWTNCNVKMTLPIFLSIFSFSPQLPLSFNLETAALMGNITRNALPLVEEVSVSHPVSIK